MTKEYLISFNIEGIGGNSAYITVEDGRISTISAEDEFYSLLRKNEKAMLKDAEESERQDLMDRLTPVQEEKLKEVHMKDYHGSKDGWEDSFYNFLSDLSLDELKQII